ncbi:uncharacterized protein LOC133848793 [Drosophila sulfurigaster albostrigata]|uniref:uncharacterized protein LOC133848793 n=1 Tax=Drosophila sulfurigaster albostrigata TaxID=89887 RepID=UPI002D21A83C|nr:uncharacterized protein LOC133848793 [Drosophila sulfurigaster albostrigata]
MGNGMGSPCTNARGSIVTETFQMLDLILLNEGTQQTFCRAGVGSIVDLTYVCSALSPSARWRLSDAYTASDHRAILCEVGGRRPSNTSDPSRWVSFNADKMDVLRFSARIQCMEAAGSAEQMATIALHALAQACKDTMPPRRSSTHHHLPVYWWNEDIATARRECNRVRRCYQRSRGRPSYTSWQREFKERRKALKHAIKASKRKCFIELCETLESDPWGKAYQLVTKKISAHKASMPPDDVMHCIVRELFPTTAGETVRNRDVATSNNSAAIELVTSAEISTIAGSMKLGKAPGPDGIPLRALRLACALRPEIFVDMFNRSTVDAATRVVEIASHAIAGSRWKGGAKEYCLMVTLDIKNAFNSARWDCILKALAVFQVPSYLLEIVRSYLSCRRLLYETSAGTEEYVVTAGVPQGRSWALFCGMPCMMAS